ncbi:MAG: hypothetical protein QOI34_1509 [Verrucomicrobiota bacterium]
MLIENQSPALKYRLKGRTLKRSVEVSKTDANGWSVFRRLAFGTYKITALENRIPASVVTVKTKMNDTVAVNLGLKSNAKNGAAKKRKRAVWVPDETGSHIGSGGGGRWETVEDASVQ